jgi:deoxyadenosine/deoxycytidine kinase
MLVLLEGNIAAGKTTLGKLLSGSGKFQFIPEPVERWQSGFAANLLERFYTDTRRWAFTLQICAFVTRTQAIQHLSVSTTSF